MKRYLAIVLALAFSVSFANAQAPTTLCFPSSQGAGNCITVNPSDPLPVTGTFTPSGTQAVSLAASSVAAGAFSVGSAVDGWDLTQGAKADAVCGTATGTCSTIALLKYIANAANIAIPSGTARIGYVSDDPCSQLTKTNINIATASGTLQLVAPSGSTQVYVCSFSLISSAAAVINLVGGTGATCITGTPVAAIGSTTAANGMSLAANGGLTFGNGGATVARTTTAGHGLCLIQSGTTAVAGNITYVQQ